jgi:predicted Zn finger-like uncharacterized protein
LLGSEDSADHRQHQPQQGIQQRNTMPIPIDCPHCDGRFRASDTAAGKKIRCPKCQEVVKVPFPSDDEDEVVDLPAPVKRKGKVKQKSNLLLMLVPGTAVLILILAAGGGVIWWLARDTGKSDSPVAKTPPPAPPPTPDVKPADTPEAAILMGAYDRRQVAVGKKAKFKAQFIGLRGAVLRFHVGEFYTGSDKAIPVSEMYKDFRKDEAAAKKKYGTNPFPVDEVIIEGVVTQLDREPGTVFLDVSDGK